MRLSAALGVFGSALLAGAIALTGAAEAKPKRSAVQPYVSGEGIVQPGLELNKRSFLDPGPVAPHGNEQAYMTQSTYFNTTPDKNYARSKFGNEALPRPLETPGPDKPVFIFDTSSYPY